MRLCELHSTCRDLTRHEHPRSPRQTPNSSTRLHHGQHGRYRCYRSVESSEDRTCIKHVEHAQSNLAKQERHAQSIRNALKECHQSMSTSYSLQTICRHHREKSSAWKLCKWVWILATPWNAMCKRENCKMTLKSSCQNVDGFHACNKRPKPIVSPWLASSPVRTLKCGKHLQAAPEYFIVNSCIYIYYILFDVYFGSRKLACVTSRTANRKDI